jgi:hypothetical protein
VILDPRLELMEVLGHYDLGELVEFEKNERGFVNTSFAYDNFGLILNSG